MECPEEQILNPRNKIESHKKNQPDFFHREIVPNGR